MSEINLEDWVQTSESPLESDVSPNSTSGEFGDLTIKDNGDNGIEGLEEEHGDSIGILKRCGVEGERNGDEETEEKVEMNEILRRLSGKFDDFSTTTKSRHRFKTLTELSQDEIISEPEIVRLTDVCSTWPCDFIDDIIFKAKVYFGRKCKLPCCQEYAQPHELARHRRFVISKRHYLSETCVTSQETDAILRWADLVRSQEWKDGQWNEKSVLHMKDTKVFTTGRVSWSAMEEHLASLAYSKKRPFVLLASRICMETLAKNRGLYSYPHQYWGFARICTDLLKYHDMTIQEGILRSLQLYLWTLKIFHSCFTTKCSEWASAGLFPVLKEILDKLDKDGVKGVKGVKGGPDLKAVVINILILMATHVSYINLAVNMDMLDPILSMANAQSTLLKRRVFSCMEIFSKNASTQAELVESSLIPLAVRQLSLHDQPITINCLVTLNTLCHNHNALAKMLLVEKKILVKAVIKLMSEEDDQAKVHISKNLIEVISQNWCSITRQSLLLACKLCVDRGACEMMVKRGLIKRLKEMWLDSESIIEHSLILEVLTVASMHHKAAEKIGGETFLPILSDSLHDLIYHDSILRIVLNMGKKHLEIMLNCGILPEIITAFGDKIIHRKHFNLVLSICAAFSFNDKVQGFILSNQARAYMLILDIAFTTNDYTTLKSCVSILAKLDSKRVPVHILRPNGLLLVAYIDKLLKIGHEDLILHGLLQLQDLMQVNFLHICFREHHMQRVVEILCDAPYPTPIQMIAQQVADDFSGKRSRHSSWSKDHQRESEEIKSSSGQRTDSFKEESSCTDDDGAAVKVTITCATDNETSIDAEEADDDVNDDDGDIERDDIRNDGNNNNDSDDDDDDDGFEIIDDNEAMVV